jgi:hypothetical protein
MLRASWSGPAQSRERGAGLFLARSYRPPGRFSWRELHKMCGATEAAVLERPWNNNYGALLESAPGRLAASRIRLETSCRTDCRSARGGNRE